MKMFDHKNIVKLLVVCIKGESAFAGDGVDDTRYANYISGVLS